MRKILVIIVIFFRSPKAFFEQIFKISLKREFMTGLILALENMRNFRFFLVLPVIKGSKISNKDPIYLDTDLFSFSVWNLMKLQKVKAISLDIWKTVSVKFY